MLNGTGLHLPAVCLDSSFGALRTTEQRARTLLFSAFSVSDAQLTASDEVAVTHSGVKEWYVLITASPQGLSCGPWVIAQSRLATRESTRDHM